MLPCDPGWVHGVLLYLSAVVFLVAVADGVAASLVLFGNQLSCHAIGEHIGAVSCYGENRYAHQNIYARYLPISYTANGLQDPSGEQPYRGTLRGSPR